MGNKGCGPAPHLWDGAGLQLGPESPGAVGGEGLRGRGGNQLAQISEQDGETASNWGLDVVWGSQRFSKKNPLMAEETQETCI